MKYFSQHTGINISFDSCELLTGGNLHQAVENHVELIDLSYQDYIELKKEITIESVSVFQVGYADALVWLNGKYQFTSLNQNAFLSLLSNSHDYLRTDLNAVIVGSEETVLSFVPVLAQVGFKNFLVSVENTELGQDLVDKLLKIYLGLDIQLISYKQVNQIESISSFLVIDFDHQKYKEISQALSYFNFLAPQSLFFDLQSSKYLELKDEALRAHLHCLDADTFFRNRVSLALELVKNR